MRPIPGFSRWFGLALLVGAGCGEDGGPAPASQVESGQAEALMTPVTTWSSAGQAWLAALPADLVEVVPGPTAESNGFTFTVGTAARNTLGPRRFYVWVHKEATAERHDTRGTGYVVVGQTFADADPHLATLAGRRSVVASYQLKATPSGAAAVHLSIVHLSFFTGEILHASQLSAFPLEGTGSVVATNLRLTGGGTLLVSGTKNGFLRNEQGSGRNFLARYTRFLLDESPNPLPSEVWAW